MGLKTKRRPSNKRANVTVCGHVINQPHRPSGTVAVELRSRGISPSHTLLFRQAIKRSEDTNLKEEIDQLNQHDPGTLLEHIIFPVTKVKVH